jgi:hypothetical protein
MIERTENHSTAIPSLARAIATGAIGFGLISLGVFATVAFAEASMYKMLGLLGAYLTWMVLFILLSGAVFGPRGPSLATAEPLSLVRARVLRLRRWLDGCLFHLAKHDR